MKKIYKIIITVIILIVLVCAVFLAGTAYMYEAIFSVRTESGYSYFATYYSMYEEALSREAISFTSDDGQTLNGYVYTATDVDNYRGVVIIGHGINSTHESYLEDISYIAANGYEVVAYDNTGCGISESKGTGRYGLSQSAIDMDCAVTFVENDDRFKGYDICLYGHSWGGYAVTAVLNNEHDITAVVSRSGFNQSTDMLMETGRLVYGDVIDYIVPFIKLYEHIKFGDAYYNTAVSALKSTESKVLIMYGSKDDIISTGSSIYGHRDEYMDNDNVSTIFYEGKGHDVTTSDKAYEYQDMVDEEYDELVEEYGGEENIPEDILTEFKASIDIERANEGDEEILKTAVEFFNEQCK